MRVWMFGFVSSLMLCLQPPVSAEIILQTVDNPMGTTGNRDYVAFNLTVNGSDVGTFNTFDVTINVTQGAPVPVDPPPPRLTKK